MDNEELELLFQFISLNEDWNRRQRYTGIKDRACGNLLIRIDERGYNIICLTNGSCFTMPWDWVGLLSSFNTSCGHQLLHKKEGGCFYNLLKLYVTLETGKDPSMVLKTIGSTQKLRDWLKDRTGVIFNSLYYKTVTHYENL